MRFSKLQSMHETLLELENDGEDIKAEALNYIKRAQKEAVNYSPEERDILRANLRHWAAYLYERVESYPDTDLPPAIAPSKVSIWFRQAGRIASLLFVVALLFLGVVQIPNIINVLHTSNTNPTPPSSDLSIIYIQQGLIIGLYIFLVIILILLWRMTKKFAPSIISAVGKRVTAVGEIVRKTLAGGGRRGKQLATLKVIEGPSSMIGQELKIFTESVKLGRDPRRSDMVFYTPEANSSVSGLHARIERVNGYWRIVSLSTSSETFINDEPLPSNEPQILQNDQIIRLGYHAQLPIIFTFSTNLSNDIPRKTDVDFKKTDDSIFDEFREVSPKKSKKETKPLQQSNEDSIFDEYRDR